MYWSISSLNSLIKLIINANVLPASCSVRNWINPSWLTKLTDLISAVCVPIVVKELLLSLIITGSKFFSFLKHLRLTLCGFLFENKDWLISLVHQSCVILQFLGHVNILTFKAILFELHLLKIVAHFNQSLADVLVLTMSQILVHSFSSCFSDSKSFNLILFITQLISSLHQLDLEVSAIFTHELVVTCKLVCPALSDVDSTKGFYFLVQLANISERFVYFFLILVRFVLEFGIVGIWT